VRQRKPREVGAPAKQGDAGSSGHSHRVTNSIEVHIHAECPKSGAREPERVTPPPHRDIEGAADGRAARREAENPLGDKRRRQIIYHSVATFRIVSALVTLIAHSMMMFYLIGKGKAVEEATIACGVIACNVHAMKIDSSALAESSRIVDGINRLLGA
jgi:hypothetical protein